MKILKNISSAIAILTLLTAPSFASITTIKINNNSSSDAIKKSIPGKSDFLGTFSPSVPDILESHSSITIKAQNSLNSNSGRIMYDNCTFIWVANKTLHSFYFHQGATPKYDKRCTTTEISSNYVTGDYSVEFNINNK